MECQSKKTKKSSYFLRCDMISFSSSNKFKFPRSSQRKERGKLKKNPPKNWEKSPNFESHPTLIGMNKKEHYLKNTK